MGEGGKRRSHVAREELSERCNIAGFEYGGRGHEPRNTSGLQKLKRARKWLL